MRVVVALAVVTATYGAPVAFAGSLDNDVSVSSAAVSSTSPRPIAIELSVAATGSASATESVPPTDSVPATGSVPATLVVVIDAGHQSVADLRMEPIGPGSKTKRPAVATGTRGRVTHIPEYKANLRIARKLRDLLVEQGIQVVMVRNKNHVDVTNRKRAKIANTAHADLFIRLHCDGVSSRRAHGISVLTPGRNKWTGPIVHRSLSAAKAVRRAVIRSTGAKDRGIVRRKDLAGFNWCKVPVVLAEMGFMTNAREDRRLATGAYQDKLAAGLTQGILAYLRAR